MKQIILFIVLSNLSLIGISQNATCVNIFIYESYQDSVIIKDTILSKSIKYDELGVKVKETQYSKTGIFHEEQFFGDSLRFVFLNDPKNNPNNRIEYRYDKFNNLISIVNAQDTMKYKKYYNDTLIVKSECISGCNYQDLYKYYPNGKLKSIQTIWQDSDTTISEWKYDKSNRMISWKSEFGNTMIRMEYDDSKKTEIEIWYSFDGITEREKTIRYLDSNNTIYKEEYYIDKKLKQKSFYEYN